MIFKKLEPQAYKKLSKLFNELEENPTFGNGYSKPLGDNRVNKWSRKITYNHRLIYIIQEQGITVLVLSAYAHYDDK